MKKNTVQETIVALLQVYCEDLERKVPVSDCCNQDGELQISPAAVAVATARDFFTTVVEEWCDNVLDQPYIQSV